MCAWGWPSWSTTTAAAAAPATAARTTALDAERPPPPDIELRLEAPRELSICACRPEL